MPATATVNYAHAYRLAFADNGDGTCTATVYYWIGYKPASGSVIPLNQPMVQGVAKGISVSLTNYVTTNTIAQMEGAITQAIETQEGLSVAGGDTIVLQAT